MNIDDLIPAGMATPPEEPEWSKYQLDIFSAVENTQDNLSIEAVAGSGKSTTIVAASKRLPMSSKNLFLAFNKAIVTELSAKLPYSVDCKTMNSLGHGLLMRKLKSQGQSPKLNMYKLNDVARTVLSDEQHEEYGTDLRRLVSLARANAVGIRTPLDPRVFLDMLGDYDVEIPHQYEQLACRQAVEVMRKCMHLVTSEFDFDDQLYMPVLWEMAFPAYDTVFIDEAQDLSTIQHLMLDRLAERGARIIAVGDSRQAIYGFRGADGASMTKLAEHFSMNLLPLSISYRCCKAVVEEAQKIVYHIEASPSAIDGEVVYAEQVPLPTEFEGTAMVLCRTNAPLFSLALSFLKHKVPCHLMSNFGQGIVKFVREFNVKTTDELHDALTKWLKTEKPKAEEKGWHGKAQLIQDKYDTLLPFCEEFEFKIQVVAALQQLISSNSGVKLATIHKAKGLEAKTVYILRPDLLPAPFAKSESARVQEMNLKYVAVTRAQEKLIFLPEEQE